MSTFKIEKYITDDFKEFIKSILKTANLVPKHIDYLTSKSNLLKFRKAFVHITFHEKENYELYELYGDSMINATLAEYLRYRFEYLRSVNWLSKLKQNLQSNEMLGSIASKIGFEKYFLYDINNYEFVNNYLKPKEGYTKKTPYKESKSFKINIMSDMFEAFIGCLVIILNEKFSVGVGYAVTFEIIKHYFNQIHISIAYEDVFDSITRIKELYEKGGRNWSYGRSTRYSVHDPNTGEWSTRIWGYPLGDKSPIPQNKMLLVDFNETKRSTKRESEKVAAELALSKLKYKFGIELEPKSPYDY